MKNFYRFVLCIMIIINSMSMVACSENNSNNNLNSCSFNLMENEIEYEISNDVNMFTRDPLGELNIPATYNNLPVSSIGNFSCCHELTKIQEGINIINITKNAFGCRCWSSNSKTQMHLQEVVFRKDAKLRTIEDQAFFCNNNLLKVVLPENFEDFGEGVFVHCKNLKELIIFNTTPPTYKTGLSAYMNGSQKHYTNLADDFTVYVPESAVEVYKSNNLWNMYNIQPIVE